jgi:hypothetical protein
LSALREKLAVEICAGAVGGPRFDTLVCDGLLPLLATGENGVGARDYFGLWQIWFPGDLPEALPPVLRMLGVFAAPKRPACHGPAQGLLGWLIESEAARQA